MTAFHLNSEINFEARDQGVPSYILDGKNIGKWLGPQEGKPIVELRVLLSLVTELLRKRIQFVCVFEPNTLHWIFPGDQKLIYARLVANFPDVFVELNGDSKAGDGILLLANRYPSATIISNDDFKDFHGKSNHCMEYSRFAPTETNDRHPRIVHGAAIPGLESLIVGALEINVQWGKNADELFATIASTLLGRMTSGSGSSRMDRLCSCTPVSI